MPEDLIIFQFLTIFLAVWNWSYSWSIPAAIAFVLAVVLELWLLRKRKKKANGFIILGAVLIVIICEYGYQATPGFDAFIFAITEIVILFALLGAVCGALIGLIWMKVTSIQ